MSTIYSSNLGQLASFSGLYAFTVPADKVLVVRDIDVVTQVVAGSSFEALFIGDLGQAFWFILDAGLARTVYQWRGRQVFGPGQSIEVSVVSGAGDITLSGYLLAAP